MSETSNSADSDAQAASDAPSNGAEGLPFTRLGEFEIRREIGRGGMGIVYEAWQASLDRSVALKVLDRQVSASKAAVARFQREAQAAAKLHHPHIVPVYAQGVADGTYFYAMEYIEGESVANLIQRARDARLADTATVDLEATVALPRERAPARRDDVTAAPPQHGDSMDDSNVTLGASGLKAPDIDFETIARHIANVANALAYAHEHGVVHRDIKPHNLLLGTDGRLRVSDFGLARLAEQPGVTMTGELVGSPLYMSPEQIMGPANAIDHRTDIYSLGATLYEWLALTPPFPGETRERVISRIMTGEPPPIRHHNPRIPIALETICAKALERDISRRYQSAAELRDDLVRFLEHRPLRARRPGAASRIVKTIRRHQLASVMIVSLLLAGGLLYALLSTRSRVAQESQAAAAAQGQTEEILDALGPEILALMRSAQAVEGLVSSSASGGDAADQEGLPSSSGPAVGSPASIALRALKEYYEATAPPEWIAALRAMDGADARPDPLLYNLQEAERLWKEGEPARALGLLDAYLAARPDDLNALRMHAVLCAEVRDFKRLAEDAATIVRLDSQSVHAYVWRGVAHLLLENLDRATVDLGWATELDRRSVWAQVMLGVAKIGQGRAPGALLNFEDALREDPNLVIALLGRASAYAADGRFDEAITDATEVLQREPDNADALTIRGDCYAARERYLEAAADYQAAMDIVGRTTELGLRYLSAVVQQRQSRKGKNDVTPAETEGAEVRERSAGEGGANRSSEGATSRPLFDWLSRLVKP